MYLYCVDDDSFHRSKAKKVLEQACEQRHISDYEIIECSDGQELLNQAQSKTPKVVLLDINMPNLDGLSALVKMRKKFPSVVIIMASSENEKIIKRLTTESISDVDAQKKEMLVNKVIARVRDDIVEPGKINSVLEAASQLGIDPIQLARKNGASEFLQKPYDVNASVPIVSRYL